MSIIFFLLLAGIIGGFVAGLVGVGGGVIYIFVLPEALNALGCPSTALSKAVITNSLGAIFFASLAANVQLWKNNNFHLRAVVAVGLSAVLSSFLVYRFVVSSPWYSYEVFNGISIVLLSYMLWLTLATAKQTEGREISSVSTYKLLLTGFCGGIIAALSGLGGGIVIIPILNIILKLGIRAASAISTGAICVSSFALTLFALTDQVSFDTRWNVGYIFIPIVLALAVGVIWASPFGVRTAQRLSATGISYAYALILLLVIIKKTAELWYI